jgi:guanylate kinase
MPDAQFVFLTPPSWDELERRLTGRGTESRAVIESRLDRAKIELAAEGEFDAVVVNDDVRRAAGELVALIEAVCPQQGAT